MAKAAPIEKVTVVVNGTTIVLDPENMKYNENTLGEYMNTEYGWIDYLGKQLEYAQKEVLIANIDAESQYSLKFMESKDAGNTESYAKAFALASANVVAAKKYVADRKETVGHIKAHLKAWKENHENAQNRGHTLRTEMKMLNRDVFETQNDLDTCTAEEFLASVRNKNE
jgi:hypothetical protein